MLKLNILLLIAYLKVIRLLNTLVKFSITDENHKLLPVCVPRDLLLNKLAWNVESTLINRSFRNTCHEVCITVSRGIQICVVRFRLGESFQQQQIDTNYNSKFFLTVLVKQDKRANSHISPSATIIFFSEGKGIFL